MTQQSTTMSATLQQIAEPPSFVRAIVMTTKPGITRLVTITSLVGFAMAALGRSWTAGEFAIALLGCAFGTFFSAAGANALNQWLEHDRDARMPRTAQRPIPAGHLTAGTVLAAGLVLCAAGLLVLMLAVGPAPMLVSLACMVVYVVAYTPLKTRTALATLVGTIPGALPPLIGWTSASMRPGLEGLIEPGGLSLFVLMTVWQLPHFWAIAWLYREDYAHGGYRVLPMTDPTGIKTALAISGTAALLIPATLWPAWAMPTLLGPVYMAIAGATGLAFFGLSLVMLRTRTRKSARRLFFASIVHLPLLLIAIVVDGFVRAVG